MYQRIDVNEEWIVAFRLSGEISAKATREMAGIVEAACADGNIRILFELSDFKVDNPIAYFDTFKIAQAHAKSVERVAVVGDKGWEKHWINIGAKLVDSEVRYYDHSRLKDAWDWIREREPGTTTKSSNDPP